jgi:hypothetical protein
MAGKEERTRDPGRGEGGRPWEGKRKSETVSKGEMRGYTVVSM